MFFVQKIKMRNFESAKQIVLKINCENKIIYGSDKK